FHLVRSPTTSHPSPRSVRKFIRKVSYDYLQRSSLEERREKGFLGDIVVYLYPFSLGDPLISHLEISGYSFISWVFYIPSGSSISYFHRDLPSFLFHRDLPSGWSLMVSMTNR